jgi:anion transporter
MADHHGTVVEAAGTASPVETATPAVSIAPRVLELRKLAAIALSLAVLAGVWVMPTPDGLPAAGQRALAMTLFTIIWWVGGVMAPAYTTLLLCLGYIVLGPVPPTTVFALWTSPLMWLTVGAFLIATAVSKSGLGARVAYGLMSRYARSYASTVTLVYVLGFLLSLLIPHPFPRTLLIMAMVSVIIERSQMEAADARALGFATFAGATATSMILLTGDALLNTASIGFAGRELTWLDWARYMAVPGVLAAVLMWGLHLLVFRPTRRIRIDADGVQAARARLGPLSGAEKRTLAWVALALLLWLTQAWHHVGPAWVALGVAVGLALPVVGDVLHPPDFTTGVNWPILMFLVGALAIGTVSTETGMAQWIVVTLLPADPPTNPFILALLIGCATIASHMVLGSALAVMSIVTPPMVRYAATGGWDALVPALLVYTAVQIHYVLPFQHVTMLLGAGPTAGYGSRETLRYGLPLTGLTLLVVLLEVAWWELVGLIG